LKIKKKKSKHWIIKLSTDANITNITNIKTQLNNLDYFDELSKIIGSIFKSIFEILYGKNISNKIIEK
jgi:hypothetical protein